MLLVAPTVGVAGGWERSRFCHVTDGEFTLCGGGAVEWTDVPSTHFPESGSYLYADQADLDPNLGVGDSPVDTFMLMYDECGRSTPLGPHEYFMVSFDTVEIEDLREVLERYVVHIFTDGTIIFFENGRMVTDAQGQHRVPEIEGQRGKVGFGPSPNCAVPHLFAEFEIKLSATDLDLEGGYSPDPIFWGGTPPNCTVTITGGPANMNIGQQAMINDNVTGGGTPVTYQWTVDGDVIKDYSESTRAAWSTTAMQSADFQQRMISFYWKPDASQRHPMNGGPTARKVRVTVMAGRQRCSAERTIMVERNNADVAKQAEDFYTSNHSSAVLTEHEMWHNNFRFCQASYGGALFFDFHRQFIDRFNSWRAEFGYPAVVSWDPATALPSGVDVDHSPRPGTTGAANAKPAWFTVAGGGGGRPNNGCVCDTAAGQTRLADFPANRTLLGCATEHPWHNDVHVALGGDMSRPATAPKDPIFWRWHEYMDSVSKDRQGLTPPTVVYQSPFPAHRFITEAPPEVTVTFSEEVRGVGAGSLRVNGSAATAVTGSGAGPYSFSGYAAPGTGPVTYQLAAGTIENLDGEDFEGDEWSQTLVDPGLDIDADGLSSGDEVDIYFTDPTVSDTDVDGMPDGYEVDNHCLEPLEDQSHPHDFAGNELPGDVDQDDDGITDLIEFINGSDPCSFTFVAGGNAIRAGFDSQVFGANDDGSLGPVPLGFEVDFFGTTYTQLFVNNNGNVTFDSPLSTFTPFDLTSTGRVIIAPLFSDVDTRAGNTVRFGQGTVDGHRAFGVTWPGVGCYSVTTHVLNYFQVVLVDRADSGPGDFDIEFNYDSIQWETGQASGGDRDCMGGNAARAGFSNGTGEPGTFFELPGSGVVGAFLDSNLGTGLIHGSLNSDRAGRYVFPVVSGTPMTVPDTDGDGVSDDIDNCPGVANAGQADSDRNGIGDACGAPEEAIHSTAGFLQAGLDGSTAGEPRSLRVDEEPEILERLVKIVDFRIKSGLTDDPERLTENLVGSLVKSGLVPPEEAEDLMETVLEEVGFGAPQLAGDCNQDGVLDISDGVCYLGVLFLGTGVFPCGDGTPGDPANLRLLNVNAAAVAIDISAAVYLLNYLFLGGPPPVQGTECFPVPDCPKNRGCV